MPQTTKIPVTYSFSNIKLAPQERVLGFEVDVSGGGFESMSSLPKGWSIAIDNKSPTETVLNADLAFGDEGLSLSRLQEVVLTLVQLSDSSHKLRLNGHLTISNLGTERRLPLSGQNFLSH